MFAQSMWIASSSVGFAIYDKYVIAWFNPQADDIQTSSSLQVNLKAKLNLERENEEAIKLVNTYRADHSALELVFDQQIA